MDLGGELVPEFPSSYFLSKTRLLLTVYVDDFTLPGPADKHDEFWQRLCKDVDLEPEAGLDRILGRHHDCVVVEEQDFIAFNMQEYAQQAVDLCNGLTGGKPLKTVRSPFVLEVSVAPEDDEGQGELAGDACKVLMKCLWLGRLARPDITKPIDDPST